MLEVPVEPYTSKLSFDTIHTTINKQIIQMNERLTPFPSPSLPPSPSPSRHIPTLLQVRLEVDPFSSTPAPSPTCPRLLLPSFVIYPSLASPHPLYVPPLGAETLYKISRTVNREGRLSPAAHLFLTAGKGGILCYLFIFNGRMEDGAFRFHAENKCAHLL